MNKTQKKSPEFAQSEGWGGLGAPGAPWLLRTRQHPWSWHQVFSSFYLGRKSKKQKRDAWQHFVLGCLKPVPPWEILSGSTWTPHTVPGLPRAPQGSDWARNPCGTYWENGEKRGGKPPQPCCDLLGALLARGWSWVSTGATSATSHFPVFHGDPSVHPQPGRSPGWLEQGRQGQEGSQEFQSHHHTTPGAGMAGRGAWCSVGIPELFSALPQLQGAGELAAPALTPNPGVSPAPSHVLTLCQHPSTKGMAMVPRELLQLDKSFPFHAGK